MGPETWTNWRRTQIKTVKKTVHGLEKVSWLGREQNSIFKAFWRVSQSIKIDQMFGSSEDRRNTVGKVTTLIFNGKSIINNVLTMEIVNTRILIFFIKKKKKD